MRRQSRKVCVAVALSTAIALPALYQTAQAAPRRGAGKNSSTATTGTATGTSNRSAPAPGAREIKMLETALGAR